MRKIRKTGGKTYACCQKDNHCREEGDCGRREEDDHGCKEASREDDGRRREEDRHGCKEACREDDDNRRKETCREDGREEDVHDSKEDGHSREEDDYSRE